MQFLIIQSLIMQFVFYPSHLLLLFLPAACLLPFHCLLVFGQSIPEKGIFKKEVGEGRPNYLNFFQFCLKFLEEDWLYTFSVPIDSGKKKLSI